MKMKIGGRKQYPDLFIALMGCLSLIAAAVLLIVADPFNGESASFTSLSIVQSNSGVAQIGTQDLTDTNNTDAITTHNYDTEYGDKDVEETYAEIASDWCDSVFDVGYRAIVSSQESYVQNTSKNFTTGKVQTGAYSFTGSQFPTFISNIVGSQQIEMAGDFNAEYMATTDQGTLVNGTLELTVYSGNDTSDLAKFFGLEQMDLSTTYELPISFIIDPETSEIISFTPGYTTIS